MRSGIRLPRCTRGAFIAFGAAMMIVQPSGTANAQRPPLSIANPPESVEDLTCRPQDPKNFGTGRIELLTPGRIDVDATFGPNSTFAQNRAAQPAAPNFDPSNLCQYHDANRALKSATRERVVFIGDSITANWINATPDLFQGNTLNRGIPGQTSVEMLLRFRQDVIDLHPRVVHILAGTNDIGRPAGGPTYRSNIMDMVELARSNGIRVVIGAITPSIRFWTSEVRPAPRIAKQNAWLKDYAKQQGLVFVDYYSAIVGPDQGMREDLHNDGLHPNRSAYLLMTPMARAAISRALRQNGR